MRLTNDYELFSINTGCILVSDNPYFLKDRTKMYVLDVGYLIVKHGCHFRDRIILGSFG